MIFDWNNGFEYYHIEQNQVPITMDLSMNISNQLNTNPGVRQPVLI